MKLHKINQIKVKAVPVIACTSIALITSVFAQEFITAKSSTQSKVETNKHAITSKGTPKVDLAITTIENEILTPIRLQDERSNRFSRGMRTHSNTYDLVETSSEPSEGARYFDVLITTKKYPEFSNAIILNNLNSTMNTVPSGSIIVKPELKQEPKIEPKTYLKLKYLTESNKLFIQQDNEWVEKSQHKFLKFLPITETTK